MHFKGQIKRVVRKSLVSNDTEYEVVFITDQSLKELMDIPADELVWVTIGAPNGAPGQGKVSDVSEDH